MRQRQTESEAKEKTNEPDEAVDVGVDAEMERLINKMILLLKLKPVKVDIGVDDNDDDQHKQVQREQKSPQDGAKRVDLKQELKDIDEFADEQDYDGDALGGLPLILKDDDIAPASPRPRRASIENVDRFTSKKMMAMSSKNVFGGPQMSKSTSGGKSLKRAVSSLYLSGSADSPTWISRIP